jgi:aspartate/glutamate racemase
VDLITPASRKRFAEMIRSTVESGGADVALLACTELSLLEPEKEEAIRGAAGAAGGVADGGGLLLLDTALLHAMAAVDFMLTDPAA